jgi:hypothetical protein
MMTIGLHLRIIGRPARNGGLDRVLAHMRAKGGVWFARRDRIAEHWLARFGGATDPTAAARSSICAPIFRIVIRHVLGGHRNPAEPKPQPATTGVRRLA